MNPSGKVLNERISHDIHKKNLQEPLQQCEEHFKPPDFLQQEEPKYTYSKQKFEENNQYLIEYKIECPKDLGYQGNFKWIQTGILDYFIKQRAHLEELLMKDPIMSVDEMYEFSLFE